MSDTPDYITPDGEEIYYWEMENRTEEMLDEVYPMFTIGYLSYEAGRVLRQIDPIAFNECVQSEIHSRMMDEELDEWREGHPWALLAEAADNAPEGALDVWLRIPEGEEESEAEANVFADNPDHFRVEWYLTDVGLVTCREFATYPEACKWLESRGFEDYSA